VRQRTRSKNQVHAILARNLAPTSPVSDLFGKTGRHWLSMQPLPADERSSAQALLRQLDFHGAELAVVDKELAVEALSDPLVARLMTIPGVDAIAGIFIVAVGDFHRFDDPDRLVAYVGLNPKVRQSGNSAPVHGRISKAGRAQVRGVLVEAAWSASRAPGPLRAFSSGSKPAAPSKPPSSRRPAS
jgi:transposase